MNEHSESKPVSRFVESDNDKMLPKLELKQNLHFKSIEAKEHTTKPFPSKV